jgi:hypothetical protein
MGIILKLVAELHSTGSNNRIAHMGIDLNHFEEIYRAHSHVRITPIDIIYNYGNSGYSQRAFEIFDRYLQFS